jgi:hypothetical protein
MSGSDVAVIVAGAALAVLVHVWFLGPRRRR